MLKLETLHFLRWLTGLVAGISLSMSALAASTELNVVPAVQQWTPAEGTLKRSRVEERILPKAEQPQPVGWYQIDIGDKVVISAYEPVGIFYGKQTLRQLQQQNPELPKGKIVDWPVYAHRMLMLDVGRKPFPLAVLKDYLKVLAWYKMNELHLHLSDEAFGGKYTGFRVECETFPGLTSKDLFYTKKELRELQDEAKALGITITPEIDMPGHARVFTDYWPDIMVKDHPGYMDVTNPKTIERMKQLLDEMIPIFDAPDFHIGTDEYRIGGDKEKVGTAFRQFINTMNAYIRSKGKNCRIWSGFEHMGGKDIAIDPTVIIDMWDPYNVEHDGNRVINASQFVTYYVPGAHYYGVNPAWLYNDWDVARQNAPSAPKQGDPRLLGGKLHVWMDHGPTGYTMTEVAQLVLPGIQVVGEKLWGTKGSKDYVEFQKRVAATLPVPGVKVLERRPVANGLVFKLAGEQTLATTNSVIPLKNAGPDFIQPWTLTVEIFPTATNNTRGVILSSDMVELCANYARTDEEKSKGPDGQEIKTKVNRRGIGLIRAAGKPGRDPASSHLARDTSRVYADPVPVGKWTTLTVVAEAGRTTVYVNGAKAGSHNDQMVCPLGQLGSPTGNSFVGKIRNLRVVDRALSTKEIGRAAGLDIPDNLAAHCQVTASASDAAHGLTPEKITDENPTTRWSSGQTQKPQWVMLDLGAPREFNEVTIAWENAYAGKIAIEVSDDAKTWQEVYAGDGAPKHSRASFKTVRARYVRLNVSAAATGWGYSIWEIEVLRYKAR